MVMPALGVDWMLPVLSVGLVLSIGIPLSLLAGEALVHRALAWRRERRRVTRGTADTGGVEVRT